MESVGEFHWHDRCFGFVGMDVPPRPFHRYSRSGLAMASVSLGCFIWLILRGKEALDIAQHGGDLGLFVVSGVAFGGAIWSLGSTFASLGLQGPRRPIRDLLTFVILVFGLLPSVIASAWTFQVVHG